MTRMYFDNVFTAVGFSFALMDLIGVFLNCLLYTSDAADDAPRV